MEDVLEVGPDGPRWRPPRWVVRLLVLAAVAIVAGVVVSRPDKPPQTSASPSAGPTVRTTLPAPAPTCDAPTASTAAADWKGAAAITLGGAVRGGPLTRRDTRAKGGPWSVLVHRADGSLGQHGAVVTFPVERLEGGEPVDIGGVHGRRTSSQVVWRLGDGYARVRGDLGVEILTQIAKATTVAGGRPAVSRLYGFHATHAIPYRPIEVHEIRYQGPPLGAASQTLGFVYTGVLRGAALEDQLFAGRVTPAGTVHGQDAVATAALGGSGMVAWSPTVGVVAYIGYSGPPLGRAEIDAMTCLARSAQPLTHAEWQRTHPTVSDQPNIFG